VVNFGKQVPMKRPGQPAELASAYVMLAEPISSYVSGRHYCGDGRTVDPVRAGRLDEVRNSRSTVSPAACIQDSASFK
jgi:hypothetical protein